MHYLLKVMLTGLFGERAAEKLSFEFFILADNETLLSFDATQQKFLFLIFHSRLYKHPQTAKQYKNSIHLPNWHA